MDALGYRMKFGVIAPSTNTCVQPDFDDMRPRGVTNHFARIHIPDMKVESDEDFENLVKAIERGQEAALDQVMTCAPQHVIMGMSGETFWGGAEASHRLLERMKARAGVGVTMGSHACEQALMAVGGVKRIALITPYMPIGDSNVRKYFTDIGFEVVRIKGLKIASPVLYAHATPATLRDAILEVDGSDVDAIVQVGTNVSMARISGMAEFFLRKPVIAINVAIYWHALRSNGISDLVYGFGQLLEAH